MREIPLEELLCGFAKRKGRSPEYFINILNGEDMTDKEMIINTLGTIKKWCEKSKCCECILHNEEMDECSFTYIADELTKRPIYWDMDMIERIIDE